MTEKNNLPSLEQDFCEYLGVNDDPETRMAFPSPGNYCHKLGSPKSIDLSFQAGCCLGGEHRSCPVLLQGETPPGSDSSSPLIPIQKTGLYAAAGLVVLVVIGLLVGLRWMGWLGSGLPQAPAPIVPLASSTSLPAAILPTTKPTSPPSTVTPVAPATGKTSPAVATSMPANISVSSPTSSPSDTAQASVTPTPTVAGTAGVTCTPPGGWQQYQVQLGDTLSSIGLRIGVSWQEIYTSNCLTSEYIWPGQILYLPILPSSIPEPTNTLAPKPTHTDTPVPTSTSMPTQEPPPPTETPTVAPTATATSTAVFPGYKPTPTPEESVTPTLAPMP